MMQFKALSVGLLLGVALLLGAGSASAHAFLVSSDPADQSEVDQAPAEITLKFNEAISPNFAELRVVGKDKTLWSKGDAKVEGSTVSVEVGELGPAGEYSMAYRVTSADGHVVSGINTFILTKAGDGTPGETVETESPDSSTGISGWWFVGGAGAAFAVALGFALRRPQKD